VRSLRRRPLRRPSTPGHDDPARSSATRNVCSEAISGSEADTENTQEHHEYFKHGPTIALLVPCSIRQIRTLLTFRGSNTDSIPHLVLAEIGHSQIQNRPLTKTAPLGLKRCPDALLFES
jgi:hypothetical protein